MQPKSISDVFRYLNDQAEYKKQIKSRIAKIILGSSVIRVFEAGTRKNLLDCLVELEIDSLLEIKTQDEYDLWHQKKIGRILSCIRTGKNVLKLGEDGLKWGHATKIFNLFIGHLVFYSPYFLSNNRIRLISYYLHVPLDRKVFQLLKSCKYERVPKSIKSLDKKEYLRAQHVIRDEASKWKLPPLYFDEYAWS